MLQPMGNELCTFPEKTTLMGWKDWCWTSCHVHVHVREEGKSPQLNKFTQGKNFFVGSSAACGTMVVQKGVYYTINLLVFFLKGNKFCYKSVIS